MKRNRTKVYDALPLMEDSYKEPSYPKQFAWCIKEELVIAHCRPAFVDNSEAWLATSTAKKLMKLEVEDLVSPALDLYGYGQWEDYLEEEEEVTSYWSDLQFIADFETAKYAEGLKTSKEDLYLEALNKAAAQGRYDGYQAGLHYDYNKKTAFHDSYLQEVYDKAYEKAFEEGWLDS